MASTWSAGAVLKKKEKLKKKKWTSLMSKLVSILPRNRGKQVLITRQAVTETKRQGTEETTGKHTSHLKITLETNKGYNRDRDMCACACIRATSMCVCVCKNTENKEEEMNKMRWHVQSKWHNLINKCVQSIILENNSVTFEQCGSAGAHPNLPLLHRVFGMFIINLSG